MRRWWVGLVVLTWSGAAAADAVPPGPEDCPEGYESSTDHAGPYCRPPMPTNCPPEHIPRVQRTQAYCEAPPLEACPPGSVWTSESPTYSYCRGGYHCDKDDDCGGGRCVDSSLCVTQVEVFRAGSYEVVHGLCADGCESSGGEDRECVQAKRCEPAKKRVASSPAAAKPFDPSTGKTAEPGSTAPSGGSVKPTKPSKGCGSCAVGGEGAGGAEAWLLLMILLAWRRR
jgi:MYXO-CTERM domain-containing protein